MGMLRRSAILLVLLAARFAVPDEAYPYPVYFKEQYYKLFHVHYIQAPDESVENIYWLEQAKKADFCNPLYALAPIGDKVQWERYRYLLDMHLNLKLIEQHLVLGSKFDKRKAYFFNAPWKEQNLESLKTAETAYRAALLYWDEASSLAMRAMKMRWTALDGADAAHWIDEAARIESGDLDYRGIIGDELARLEKVRAEFQAMDASTY
jgi:hypothetical protein